MALLVLSAATFSIPAQAQTHRPFSPQTLRGELVVLQTPDALLNGKPARLAPGSRLRSDGHMLLPPASVAGQKLTVHYTVDPQGLLMDVWVLNPAELANKTWPRTPQEAANWAFEPGTQTWTKR